MLNTHRSALLLVLVVLLSEARAQNLQNECTWTDWEEWSACSISCGESGTRQRTRYDIGQIYFGENYCGEEGRTETDICQGPICPFEFELPLRPHCNAEGLTIPVRTNRRFHGRLFALGYNGDYRCVAQANGDTETTLLLTQGTCGVEKQPTKSGYKYVVHLGAQLHKQVITDEDLSVRVECEVIDVAPVNLSVDDDDYQSSRSIVILDYSTDISCQYNVRPQDNQECSSLLECEVGRPIEHDWDCRQGFVERYRFLIHDCTAQGENVNEPPLYLLDEEGCAADPQFFSTPLYGPTIPENQRVTKQSTMFKFPKSTTRIRKMSPFACNNENGTDRSTISPRIPIDYNNPPQNYKFERTISVSSRIINVFDKPEMTPDKTSPMSQFCSSEF